MDNFSEKSRARLDTLTRLIQSSLDGYMNVQTEKADKQKKVAEAMEYSLSAGGKRIRPLLVLEFCRVCGGDEKSAVSAACALEMIHTFSLIHDDLPCMDNDDYRRGKPSCHKAYGESEALLAGDALLNLAYGIISRDERISPETAIKLIANLTEAVGVFGMIGGQVIDTDYDGDMDEKLLLEMYSMKTGALLKTACQMGCIAAGAEEAKLEYAAVYAEKLGLAFQIIDDILDITGDEKLLGKPVGSDKECGKVTYASLKGVEAAREAARRLTDEAMDALSHFEDTEFLKELTMFLLKREY